MQKPPTKAELRKRLERDLEAFVSSGGDVKEVPRGVSGRETGAGMIKPDSWHMEKSQGERTQIPDVLNAIDARKAPKQNSRATVKKKRARKKLIYDDFGEPLRWVWVEE